MPVVWFCKISGNQLGPLSSQQLRAMVAEGRLAPEDHVRQGAQGPWLPAAQVKGLFAADEPAAAAPEPRELPVAKPLERSAADPPSKAKSAGPRAAKPPAPPVRRPAAGRPATSRMPQAQAPPKATPAPAAARLPTAGGADHNRFNVVTGAGTPAAGTSGGSAAPAAFRNRRRNDALVVGSLVVLVIGLAVAGIVLALATRDSGESAKESAEAASDTSSPGSTIQPPEGTGPADKPADRKWLDASKDTARQGDVRVKISSVVIGGPRVIQEALGLPGRPRREYLLVSIELENAGADRKLEHAGWGGNSPASSRATLTDSLGKTYRLKRFRGVPADGQPATASIGPKEQIEDLLVFDPPAEAAEFLLLELPAAAFGQPGDVCFKIPREMIVTADEQPEPQDPARPLEGGVPEIDRGIAELEAAEEKIGREDEDPDADGPDIFRDYPELRGDDQPVDDDSGLEGKFDDFQPSPQERDK